MLKSKNMNYIFNVEYFDDVIGNKDKEKHENVVKEKNLQIVNFNFTEDISFDEIKKGVNGYCEFNLYTLYPGLLIGTGYPHGIAVAGALKQGFSFDYVTGLPYIPGSSLKGMIRSFFPGEAKDKEMDTEYSDMIKEILGKEELDIGLLKKNMFENNDVFLGAYPSVKDEVKKTFLEIEYITPHKEKFKNPNPISIIKVKPAVKFSFRFIFSDYIVNDTIVVSAEEKLNLCKELILLMGIGAKTNTGFGKFAEKKPTMHKCIENRSDKKNNDNNAPICKNPNCNKRVSKNNKTGKYYDYCWECFKRDKNI